MNNNQDHKPDSLPSSSEVLQRVLYQLPNLCKLTRDVFISPYDLYLVDRATGVLGGFCQGDAETDPNIESESGCFADSEELLRDTFAGMHRPLPWIFTPSGAHYFLPALAMDIGALNGFMALPYAEKVRVCVRTKMCLVDGERVPGFDDLDPEELGSAIWEAMFDFDPEITGPDVVDLKQTILEGPIEMAMWMDRCLDRMGEPRPLPMFEKAPLKVSQAVRKFKAPYRRAYHLLSTEGGLHGLHPHRD